MQQSKEELAKIDHVEEVAWESYERSVSTAALEESLREAGQHAGGGKGASASPDERLASDLPARKETCTHRLMGSAAMSS